MKKDNKVMKNYDSETFPSYNQEIILDKYTLESMWQLFVQIGKFWNNSVDLEQVKSKWLVFIINRIKLDPELRS